MPWVVAFLAMSPIAPAATYEPAPPFCDGEVVHDYLKPFHQMRKLHSPPATGRVAFGPRGLRFTPLPSLLVAGRTTIGGYGLYLDRRGPAARLDWSATTSVWRVDWRGRARQRVTRTRRHVSVVSRRRPEGFRFRAGKRPAAYRLTVVFRDRSGRKLGGYGVYFRVVRPTHGTRLALNASSYSPESTVFARVENYGTATVRYGADYAIERLEGSTWEKAPESPSVFIRPLWGAGPGTTGIEGCSAFRIPASMPPGRYRMKKEIEYAIRKSLERPPTILSAEFDITG